ncbi:galactosylgalactosylxylosylprotein 3-beta-glucuronosyltransferase S isoform X2 [Drosophila obscura]|uniref:galactosylgalactosylxylosylprotein 3-beta-glucuronosyltransferase S isoform X2 n=1 Tax=Drosophila obscura TaxID=7282 RepID=UPI001BB2A926|nr:galactosylgalactosylxylosylprotein 3-beta-glucuronosyltransferase S isoform X2 [Drosophila obscura]
MPSAYYAPLDQPQTSSDDDEEEDIERHQQQQQNKRHQRRPKGAAPSIPFLKAHPHSPMAHLRGSSGVVGGRRRCLLPLLGALLFLIAFCYFTLGVDTRLALGLGGGGGASDDSDDGMHSLDGILSRALNETLHLCSEGLLDRRLYVQDKPMEQYGHLPIIYFVTPTYPRREQIPELTRLAHTLLHVPRLHWLVANDQEGCNMFMDMMLKKFGIPYTHLASPMPSNFRKAKPAPRGVANRRAALQWLRQRNLTNGILYFGDDDNTYDLRLFSEIRQTQRVSMFPVGFIADYGVSGPVVRKGKVVAFLDSWLAGRRWPVDMAGFAVNLEYMAQFPYVNMPYKPGFEEDRFLRSIGLRLDHIEPRGNNCTEILVWHTQTKNKKAAVVRLESEYLDGRSNLGALFRSLKIMGVASASDTEGPKALISKNGKAAAHSTILS